jgi:phosphoadenosine phosphosulfate reductase
MPQLIKGRALAADRWTLLREAPTLADVPNGEPVIVPLSLWRERRAALLARGDVGVWLRPDDDPAELAVDVKALPLIAIDFPQFTDGRGYSLARLLRDRHGFHGELRAIGDVLRDQLFALAECGFDAFAVRADRDAAEALAGLDDFDGVYAATSRTPQPWFRRRLESRTGASAEASADLRVAAAVDVLRDAVAQHPPAVYVSSFAAEGMVLIDLIARHALPIRIVTLDTGRLPEETYALMDTVRKRYGLPIDIYTPDTRQLQALVREHGVNGFYDSLEVRQRCCALRKSEPLARALVAKGAWITGQRRDQAVTRQDLAVEEYDAVHRLPKFNPLADWTEDDVWAYLRAHGVPYNPLHDRGYPSIGCTPCTRAIRPGEHIRAGRWWWEAPEHKECGLHRRLLGTTSHNPEALPEAVSR